MQDIEVEKSKWWNKDDNILENVGNVLYKAFLEPAGSSTKNNKEYQAKLKEYEEAYELFEKYLYTYCDDAGSFNADWGYLITAEKDDNSWVEDFTQLAKDIYGYNTKEGNAFTADGKIGVSYTCNLTGNTSSDYAGVSVMVIANTPFVAKDGSELTFADDNAIISYLKASFNGKGKSLYDVLKDGLRNEDRTIAYNEYIKVVPQDIYERDEEKNKITVNKDYKDVIEINVKKLKKNIYDQYLGK